MLHNISSDLIYWIWRSWHKELLWEVFDFVGEEGVGGLFEWQWTRLADKRIF